LLSAFYEVLGSTPWSEIILNTICSAITVLLSYSLAKRMFDFRIALIAALGVAIYPTLLVFDGELLITSTAVLLFTAIVYTSWRAAEDPNLLSISLAGLIIGLGAITRPTMLPLVLILPVCWIVKRHLRSILTTLRQSAVLLVATAVPILPVFMTNWLSGDDLVLISSQGGVNFYIGNAANSDGVTVQAPGAQLRLTTRRTAGINSLLHDNVWTTSVEEAENYMGRSLKPSEVSRFWYDRAWEEIAEQPWQALMLNLRKYYLFWHGYEIFNNKPLYFVGEYSPVVGALIWSKGLNFPSGVLFPLMFVGLIIAWIRKERVAVPGLALLIFSLTASAFFVCSRFRQPVIPVALILAVYGVVTMVRMAKSKDRLLFPFVLGSAVGILVLNWGGNIDSAANRSQSHAAEGVAYLNVGDFKRGLHHLEKSVEILPNNIGSWFSLTQGALFLGDQEYAEDAHRRAIAANPDYMIFHFGLACLVQQKGELKEAAKEYRTAIKLAPGYAHSYWEIANVFVEQHQYDSALYYLQRLDSLGDYADWPDRDVKLRISEIKRLSSQ